ncbi:hypothetical protein SCHPADRAFT_938288 [Schizopora paradoxa]|uniref:Uncharacterized protein n=1 Tax=Schizopora paradoxa TaxID=27342 RepID=A0A0H2RVX9_9AGAM|nr:hypothetical protein SCHPADRAFT_938288 [Schizopora paradoxa]
MSRSACLNSVLSIVDDTLKIKRDKQLRLLNSSSRINRYKFVVNLALVTLGIRGSYLIDTFVVEEPESAFIIILEALNKAAPTIFSALRVAYESESGQCFLLNRSVLATNATKWYNGTCVLLTDEPSVMELPPTLLRTVQDLLQYFEDSSHSIYRFPPNLGRQILIPLAGVLLEYPVAYMPTSDEQTIFLPGVALDVYHCTLSLECAHDLKKAALPNTIAEHSLLRFSCPVCVGESNKPLSPSSIERQVGGLFRDRLSLLEDKWTLKMSHEIVTLDRVAL